MLCIIIIQAVFQNFFMHYKYLTFNNRRSSKISTVNVRNVPCMRAGAFFSTFSTHLNVFLQFKSNGFLVIELFKHWKIPKQMTQEYNK